VESNHTTDKQLEAEWKKIKNQAEIARKFGVSRAWISKVFLKKNSSTPATNFSTIYLPSHLRLALK